MSEERDVLGMDEAMRLLRKTVANKGPDYVYEGIERDEYGLVKSGNNCFYVKDGQPSCVVGHALVDFGIDPVVIATSYNDKSAYCLPDYDRVEKAAALVFQKAQKVQDSGGTWGEALDAAERHYKFLGGME